MKIATLQAEFESEKQEIEKSLLDDSAANRWPAWREKIWLGCVRPIYFERQEDRMKSSASKTTTNPGTCGFTWPGKRPSPSLPWPI